MSGYFGREIPRGTIPPFRCFKALSEEEPMPRKYSRAYWAWMFGLPPSSNKSSEKK